MYQAMEELLNSQLWPHQWIQLPDDFRMFLRDNFKIPKTGAAHVVDNRLETDGTTVADLKVLSASAMQDFLQTEEKDFNVLFKRIVEVYKKMKVEKNAIEPETTTQTENQGTIGSGDQEIVRSETTPKKGKRSTVSPAA